MRNAEEYSPYREKVSRHHAERRTCGSILSWPTTMLQRPSLRVANQTKPGLGYGSVTPSANSTEYASLENLRAFEEERLLTEGIQLKTMDGGEDSFYAGEEARIRRRRCRGLVVVGGVLAAVMVFWHRPTSSTTTPSTPSTTTTTVVSSTGPFSTLDPVADLGFANYTRPQAAPRAVQHHKGPLPTNAWYQNLILLDEGPPTVNHRAYSMPYVVDAAGPIPGLRVHPNHVLGSTNVVQLNVVENLGLTVGVSGSVDVDYSVGAMTPLGVTLEWVCTGLMLNGAELVSHLDTGGTWYVDPDRQGYAVRDDALRVSLFGGRTAPHGGFRNASTIQSGC